MNRVSLRQRLAQGDSGWSLRANRWGGHLGSRAYFSLVSRLGDGLFWYVLMVAMIVADGMAGLAASVHLAGTGVIALTLYKLLKRWTRRRRPFACDARIRALVAPLDEFSFPSGHTLHAVAFSLVAIAHYPLLIWLLLPFTASVAASRVVLGLHFPSDVVAATLIGVGLAAFSLWLVPGISLLD